MLGKLKYKLRELRSHGKFTRTIGLMVRANAHAKSVNQLRRKTQATQALQSNNFGDSPQSWIDFIWSAAHGFFRPIQQPNELASLIELIAKRKPKSVLEIGTANGGSLFLFCRAAADDATIVSVDLPGGINGGGYPNWKTPLYEKFAKPSQTLHLLRLNSHEVSTVNRAMNLSPTGKFDLIMIDADHSYNGVKRDFQLYRKLVSENGIIVLHDVIKNRFDPSIQVDKFWDEIKHSYVTEEIVFGKNQGNMGIGVVFF